MRELYENQLSSKCKLRVKHSSPPSATAVGAVTLTRGLCMVGCLRRRAAMPDSSCSPPLRLIERSRCPRVTLRSPADRARRAVGDDASPEDSPPADVAEGGELCLTAGERASASVTRGQCAAPSIVAEGGEQHPLGTTYYVYCLMYTVVCRRAVHGGLSAATRTCVEHEWPRSIRGLSAGSCSRPARGRRSLVADK